MPEPREEPQLAAKSKNKLAQQRFRQRQREKRTSLALQIATLEARVDELQAVHQSLEIKNRALEQLAAHAKVEEVDNDFVLDWSECFAEFFNATRRQAKPLLTARSFRGFAMSPSFCRTLRLNFAHSLSQIFGKAPILTSEVQREVEDYVLDTRAKRDRVMQCYCCPSLAGHSSASPHVGPNEYDPKVASLVSVMNLTPTQVEALLAAKKDFDSKISAISKDRLQATQKIRQSMDSSACPAAEHDSIVEASQHVELNLNAEARCIRDFHESCNKIVSPIQEAVALVAGYRSGIWFDLWDIPCILRQMKFKEGPKLRTSLPPSSYGQQLACMLQSPPPPLSQVPKLDPAPESRDVQPVLWAVLVSSDGPVLPGF